MVASIEVTDHQEPAHTFDRRGDCVLQLKDRSTILVSAKVLILASSVLAQLLTSGFKESKDYATDRKIVLPLLHDDPGALTTICSMLHHQDGDTSSLHSAGQLYQVAIVADKYDLLQPLRPHVTLYCQNIWTHAAVEDLYQLLFVAYVFDLPKPFARISWRIVLDSDGGFTALPPTLDHALVQHNVLAELACRAMTIRSDLTQKILELWPSNGTPNQCQATLAWFGDCMQTLQRHDLLLPERVYQKSTKTMMDTLHRIEEPTRGRCENTYCYPCRDRNTNLRHVLRDWKEQLLTRQFGICLDCVKNDRRTTGEKSCRVSHVGW